MILADAVNLFYPLLFWLDEGGAYHACPARHVLLIVQILLFFLTSVFTKTRTESRADCLMRRQPALFCSDSLRGVY